MTKKLMILPTVALFFILFDCAVSRAQSNNEERLVGWWTINIEQSLAMHMDSGGDAEASAKDRRAAMGLWIHYKEDQTVDFYMKSFLASYDYSITTATDDSFEIRFVVGEEEGSYQARFNDR